MQYFLISFISHMRAKQRGRANKMIKDLDQFPQFIIPRCVQYVEKSLDIFLKNPHSSLHLSVNL